MQQRQPRLGDVLDDYCPRERRLTNHAVVAMVGEDIKQTRCMTCDAEHEYKHAKVPRQRRKGSETAALYSQVLAGAPKRVAHDPAANGAGADEPASPVAQEPEPLAPSAPLAAAPQDIPPADDSEAPADITDDERADDTSEEGPVHRPLIRATLPRQEGQVPPPRPAPDFTIRQPGGGRPNRFRPRNQRGGGAVFQGNNRGNGGNATGSSRNGAQRFPGNSNRPPQGGGPGRRGNQQRQNRKRFK